MEEVVVDGAKMVAEEDGLDSNLLAMMTCGDLVVEHVGVPNSGEDVEKQFFDVAVVVERVRVLQDSGFLVWYVSVLVLSVLNDCNL